jgi:hypothetical protein
VLGFRHNPYIGNFHRINYVPFNSENFFQNIMNENKTNAMIGLLRHSPSVISRSRNSHGKKSSQLAKKQQQQQQQSPPVLSRLALLRNRPKESNQQSQNQPDNRSEPSFVSSLREFHRNVYSVSSLSSQEGNSPLSPLVDHPVSDNDIPMCAICMEQYCNGDEILTLKCSHCFHSECISKWFYQDCLNSEDMRSNFTCPHCRKTNNNNHNNNNNNNNNEESKENQELGSIDSETLLSLKKLQISASDGVSIVSEEGILTESLFKLGKSLLEEDGGYDFVSVNSLNSQRSSAEPKRQVQNPLPTQQQQQQQPVIPLPPPQPQESTPPPPQQQPYIEPPSPGAFSVSNFSVCGIPINSFS